jgi:23S rRNA (adenine2503-C2)-methyltransferase
MTAAALQAEDSAPLSLAGATRAQITGALTEIGTPERELKMRASQLWHWIYHRGAREFSAMRNIARPVLDRLGEHYTLARPAHRPERMTARPPRGPTASRIEGVTGVLKARNLNAVTFGFIYAI